MQSWRLDLVIPICMRKEQQELHRSTQRCRQKAIRTTGKVKPQEEVERALQACERLASTHLTLLEPQSIQGNRAL